jgi:hypothetical protein
MGYVAFRTGAIYKNIKTNQRGWQGKVHVADVKLGFSPVRNTVGAQVFPMGKDIPIRYDEDGFRAPVEALESSKPSRPLILALGCSFTYGAAIYAKDAYPYLVGKSLKGTSKNAGVCSYGLSQMLLLARELVPTHKPDYLLVQYSPWLVKRARRPFAPSYFGKLPKPFFYEKDHHFAIYPPVFLNKIMGLPVSRYRKKPASWTDAFSFYCKVGFPLIFHDNFNMLKYGIFKKLGMIPIPTSENKRLIKYVYTEMNRLAKKSKAKMVIIVLGNNATAEEVNQNLFPSDALLVNAQYALLRRLPVPNHENYLRAYAHWRGNPPKMVDKHPNEVAHRIIADAVVSEIKRVDRKWSKRNISERSMPKRQ